MKKLSVLLSTKKGYIQVITIIYLVLITNVISSSLINLQFLMRSISNFDELLIKESELVHLKKHLQTCRKNIDNCQKIDKISSWNLQYIKEGNNEIIIKAISSKLRKNYKWKYSLKTKKIISFTLGEN